MAKYVVTWKARQGGTAQQNHDDAKKNLATFAKWTPPAGQDFQQFLARPSCVAAFGHYGEERENPRPVHLNRARTRPI